jgi:hypothetical protein
MTRICKMQRQTSNLQIKDFDGGTLVIGTQLLNEEATQGVLFRVPLMNPATKPTSDPFVHKLLGPLEGKAIGNGRAQRAMILSASGKLVIKLTARDFALSNIWVLRGVPLLIRAPGEIKLAHEPW